MREARFQRSLLFALGFVLFCIPKLRIVLAGVPLYAIDGVIGLMLLSVLTRPLEVLPREARWFVELTLAYAALIVLSELRGALAYSLPLEWLYMTARFLLAASLVYVIPTRMHTEDDIAALFSGITLGLLASSAVIILYSFAATRPMVLHTVFAWSAIAPESSEVISKATTFYEAGATLRGRSMIGGATFTSGVLACGWPLAFVALMNERFRGPGRVLAMAAAVITPLGILATYGRTAWLSVLLVFLGLTSIRLRGRLRMLLALGFTVCISIALFPSDISMMPLHRLTTRARDAIENPFEETGDRERFYSFIEPFVHLAENPSWLLVGAGRSGQRLTRRQTLETETIFDEGARATHSAFSMAYYSFGFLAAVCHVAFMVMAMWLLVHRSRSRHDPGRDRWGAMLLVWLGLLPWWLFGHGASGEPRGAMVFFLVYGILVAMLKREETRDQSPEVGDR